MLPLAASGFFMGKYGQAPERMVSGLYQKKDFGKVVKD